MNAEQERIYSTRASLIINILKGLGIWMIVVCNFFNTIGMHPYIEKLADSLQLGCQIFFILSCFGLCLSYSKQKQSFGEYFKKRVLKLFLAYYVMIFITLIYKIIVAIVKDQNILQAINPIGIVINALFLNGLVPIESINNQVVFGGWFIGTLFILYMLFPLMYKIFSSKKTWWNKTKIYLFPIIVCLISAIIMGGIFVLDLFSSYKFFAYASFINQVCAFVFGFVLFELYQTIKIKKVKLSFIKSLICAIGAIGLWVFFPLAKNVIVVVLVALATLYMFCFLFNNAFTKDNLDSDVIMRFLAKSGRISVGIFYTHIFFVRDFTSLIATFIFKLNSSPHIIIKACVGLFVFILCYWIGKLFTLAIDSANKPLLNKFKV